MRPIGIGLAIALIAAVLAPASSFAASAPSIPKESLDKGKKDAPGLVTSGGFDCQVANARFIGDSADPKTKQKQSFYELACTGNEGLIVAKTAAATTAYTCLETAEGPDGKPTNLACQLPENKDPKAGLAGYVSKGGAPTCTIDKARALGHSDTNTFFEVACHDGSGYIVKTSAPPRLDKEVEANPCVMYDPGGNVNCKLTDRAAQLAVADKLAAGTPTPCTVKDRRYVGISQSHEVLWEVSCQQGKGYVLVQATTGALDKAVDCVNSDLCQLTDAREAKTEQAGLYSKLAKKAGFDCDVKSYEPFPASAGLDVVEMTCNNRPDGAVGVFTATGGFVYDCAHSELEGYRCSMSKPDAAIASLTADLKKLNKTTCTVSSSRAVGVTSDRKGYIEVECSDGLPGFMIEYNAPLKDALTPINVLPCSLASGIAGGCKLPQNVKKS
ncbi:hypothetical protein ACO2Q3_22250 [Caulobacter sp. KR2-114]|uniref:hypothetical protein n=1 Tax=Caulobacter sp. KR2-114 TaxID=3400912 RepID=UPI003C096295